MFTIIYSSVWQENESSEYIFMVPILFNFSCLNSAFLSFLLQEHIFHTLENDPLFARQAGEDVSVEKKRDITFHRCKQLFRYDFLTRDEMMQNPFKMTILNDCLGMYDWSLGAKFFLNKMVSRAVF